MPTRNVNLTDDLDRFIEDGIASGRFGNASEIVREGLRLLEEREREDQAKLDSLRAAVKEGIDDIERGDYVTLRCDRDIIDFMSQLRKEAAAERAAENTSG